MLFLQTSLPMDVVRSFFSNKIKGIVQLRRFKNGYVLRCEPTPAYLAWRTHLNYHGSDTELIQGISVYIRPYLPSKL
jgi:hypothetical protein